MAKQKNLTMTGMMDEFDDSKTADTVKQKKLDEQQKKGGGEDDPKRKGSDWRRQQRPYQKTIHFDRVLHQKINLLKNMEGKPVEDIIYDIVAEWFDKNFDKKELLGQL